MCDGDNGPASYRYVTASGVVLQGRARLYAVIVTRTNLGGRADVYDGITAAGAPIVSSRDAASLALADTFAFPQGVGVDVGLYVAVTNAIVTLIYKPLPS